MGGHWPRCANLEGVTKTPVVRARAGTHRRIGDARGGGSGTRHVGYNRSVGGRGRRQDRRVRPTTDLTEALSWASNRNALIVLAVPMPAVGLMLSHVAEVAPGCPLTDVISVKGAVLDEVRAAGLLTVTWAAIPWPAPRTPAGRPATPGCSSAAVVLAVDGHVDAQVWAQVMHLALDCGAVVVPAKSDEHDAAAASISHLPHLLAEALAVTAGEVPLAFSLAAGSFRDGTRVAATSRIGCARCVRQRRAVAAPARPGAGAADPHTRATLSKRVRLPNSWRPARRAGAL